MIQYWKRRGSQPLSIKNQQTICKLVFTKNGDKQWRMNSFALMRNKRWRLVPPQQGRNVIGCKWIFRITRKDDENIERYKTRLVSKVLNQRYGFDYADTFNPIFKPTTIQLILSIAISKGKLKKPPYFQGYQHSHYACKLRKQLYDLKQSPREWYT